MMKAQEGARPSGGAVIGVLMGLGLSLAAWGAEPDLSEVAWIATGPVAEADLVAVEVWATWCGPCHATFPLLSELQAAHPDRLRVVALSDEDPATVGRFVTRNRAEMRFAVAVDPAGDVVRSLLFGGYGGRGLPSAYLLDGGRVVWGGEPAALPAAVEARLASTAPPAEEGARSPAGPAEPAAGEPGGAGPLGPSP